MKDVFCTEIKTDNREPTSENWPPITGRCLFHFDRKIRIVKKSAIAVCFPCYDDQCHTRIGKPHGNVSLEYKNQIRRSPLGCRGGSRCPERRAICLCCFQHRCVLPSLMRRTASPSRKCPIFYAARSGRAGWISRLPALSPEIRERQARSRRRQDHLPLHRATSRRTTDPGSFGQGISPEPVSPAAAFQSCAGRDPARICRLLPPAHAEA